MDCKLAKGLSSEQLAEIEKKAQGIATGGPSHFGGSGASRGLSTPSAVPPPPSSATAAQDPRKLDQVIASAVVISKQTVTCA